MAASKAQKQQAARLLAIGKTEHETAAELGLGRSTIQRWKKNQSFESMIQSARTTSLVEAVQTHKEAANTGHRVLESVAAVQTQESEVSARVWALFDRLEEKTMRLLEQTSVDDLSPRNLPALIKACTDVAQVGLSLNDRVSGMGILIDGYQRLEQTRQKGG